MKQELTGDLFTRVKTGFHEHISNNITHTRYKKRKLTPADYISGAYIQGGGGAMDPSALPRPILKRFNLP